MENEGSSVKPFVIAEISGNHNGSLERALKIIDACAAAGVDAVKIQTYTADTITLNVDKPNFRISADHELWGSRTLYDLYSQAYTPWEWHEPIFQHCRELDLVPFSSPFDETAVDFLESLDCPIYKIASLEIVDLPLIKLAASTGKPMIISTGTATLSEIEEAVDTAKNNGTGDITLLVCTSSYPADPKEANLNRIHALRNRFGVKVGLSDHTLGSLVALGASALGADAIEKHVTLCRSDGGVDSAFSMEPDELRQMVRDIRVMNSALGSSTIGRTQSESESLRLRPSIYFVKDVKPGEIITEDMIKTVRPAGGFPPKYWDQVIGSTTLKSVSYGDPVTEDNTKI